MRLVYSQVKAEMNDIGADRVQKHIDKQVDRGLAISHYSTSTYTYFATGNEERNAVVHNFVWRIIDAREALDELSRG